MRENNYCRVCGLYREDKPWGEDGVTPTYDICPCCGTEFGYEDINIESIKDKRNNWLANGMNWFLKKEKPEIWNSKEQLNHIPEQYR